MITDILAECNAHETTAAAIVRHFAAAGIGREQIRGEHLEPLYAALSRSANAPLGPALQAPRLASAGPLASDAVWGAIVETRCHPALERVVSQFSERLGIGIQVFHGSGNERFIRSTGIARLVDEGRVTLTLIDEPVSSLRHYNALLLSMAFWRALAGRNKILVFQADCVLNHASRFRLEDFLQFDYIGSSWDRRRPTGIIADGGNGGLSLRDWSLSTQCLERFPAGLWPGGEDGYFAFHIDLLGGRVGRQEECQRFSVENASLDGSFGGHKVP